MCYVPKHVHHRPPLCRRERRWLRYLTFKIPYLGEVFVSSAIVGQDCLVEWINSLLPVFIVTHTTVLLLRYLVGLEGRVAVYIVIYTTVLHLRCLTVLGGGRISVRFVSSDQGPFTKWIDSLLRAGTCTVILKIEGWWVIFSRHWHLCTHETVYLQNPTVMQVASL